jgi:hypothetical protein
VDAAEVIVALEAPSEDRRPLMNQLEQDAPCDALVGALGAEDRPGPRHMFAAALGAARCREAIPLLRAAARSDDRGLALAAQWALDQLG